MSVAKVRMVVLIEPALEQIEIDLLLEGVFRKYGFDFRNYSTAFIKRRIWQQVLVERVSSISELQSKVLHDPRAKDRLIASFSIPVTEMFRNAEFFIAFREKAIPWLQQLSQIKIWHAGCATGQEVYSMAILLYEAGMYEKTRIYATDISASAIQLASDGKFSINTMQEYTKNYQQAGGIQAFSEYYTAAGNSVIIKPFFKKNIVFSQHNLVSDHSFNEFHVIVCRNVIIYFNKALQERVFRLFYGSLCTNGILGLGSKEAIKFTNQAAFFCELDSRAKLYQKVK